MMRNQRVTVLSKKHQNVSPGGPFWLQNGLALTRERPKIQKIIEKHIFFYLAIFAAFFDDAICRLFAQLCENCQKCSVEIRPEWLPPALNWKVGR